MDSSPRFLLALAVCAALVGCSPTVPPNTDPIRLIDQLSSAVIEGSPAQSEDVPEGATWTFESDSEGWSVALGIEGFRVEDGALAGSTAMPTPPIGPAPAITVPLPELPVDEVWAVEVRARVSAGANLAVRFGRGADLVLPAVFGNPMGIFQTPLQAGPEMRDYVIRPSNPLTVGEGPGHLVLSPSDAVGADFAIERVRLVLRKEHLHSVPSGASWQGLGEIYHETIVSRSPEKLSFDVELPEDPFLELRVGSIEAGPTTFRVEVTAEGESPLTWEQSITEPDQWTAGKLDLGELGGQPVRVSLQLDGAEPGSLGFWGAAAVRSGMTATADATPDQPQGVILILTDTLRRDQLELYGYGRETAPTINRLATEGVRFADAISQATWTKVSVPAIQTGLYPTTHTVANLPDRLPASATTMAEVFREAGYATLALTSIPFVGRMTNLHQGYESMHEPGSLGDVGDDLERGATSKSSLQLVPRLLDWLDERDGSKFFALLHVADAHSPFRPAPEHELLFAAEGEMDRLDEMTEQVRPLIKHPLMKQFGMPRREELDQAGLDPDEFVGIEVNGLDGSIKGMDDQFAALMQRLDELGLRDKVLIALVADHGTELLEHGDHFHGHTLYGELNRVPMLLWGPSYVPSGVDVAATVQTIDLMPTMLDLAGLPTPEPVQGRSLTVLFDGSGNEQWRRPAITEAPVNFRGLAKWSLISEGWKLIRKGALDGEPGYELYNHTEDPINLNDLAEQEPETVERLARLMENWRAEATNARLDDAVANATLDAAELERLRSLGYVQ